MKPMLFQLQRLMAQMAEDSSSWNEEEETAVNPDGLKWF